MTFYSFVLSLYCRGAGAWSWKRQEVAETVRHHHQEECQGSAVGGRLMPLVFVHGAATRQSPRHQAQVCQRDALFKQLVLPPSAALFDPDWGSEGSILIRPSRGYPSRAVRSPLPLFKVDRWEPSRSEWAGSRDATPTAPSTSPSRRVWRRASKTRRAAATQPRQ